jgi:drug/metabolite transporter (DMT)-like permease
MILGATMGLVIWGSLGWKLYQSAQRPKIPLLAIGMLNATIPRQMISWGQLHFTSGFAGVSIAAVGFIVFQLAHVFIPGEKMTLRRFVGFAISFDGVAILNGDLAFV